MRKWFERFFRALGKAIESFLREFRPPLQPIFLVTLDPPADFNGRIPVFAGNYINSGEILLISHPRNDALDQRYGFHHISLNGGMITWDSDSYDDGLTTASTQLLSDGIISNASSHLALVPVERFDPYKFEVRVYNSRCEPGSGRPIFSFAETIHVNEETAGMGTFYNQIWTVTKEGILHWYAPVQINEDLDLVSTDDGLKNAGFQIMRAYILLSGILFFEGKLHDEVQTRWCMIGNTSSVNWVPNTPPWAGSLGPRCRDLSWRISGPTWGQLLVTGTRQNIWMYHYPGTSNVFHLVRFQASNGTTHDGYQLPGWGDWDVRFLSDLSFPMIDPSGTVDDTGEVVLLLAFAGGVNHPGIHNIQLAVRLDPSGQHTFREVLDTVKSPNGEFKCTFWHHDSRYQRSRFDVDTNGAMQWTHEGRRE